MRIGFDMLAVQSPHHGSRGIGRYSANLVSNLLARDDSHEYVLYVHDDLTDERVPRSDRAEVRAIRPRWDHGETLAPRMERLVRNNPDDLDAFVVLSPFERWSHYMPPAKPDHGLKMLSVVYDLIPFLFQNDFAPDPTLLHHYRILDKIIRYDGLLAISEATRNDCLAMLRLPPEKVVSISGASSDILFHPAKTTRLDPESRATLVDLGITRPYVLNVGGLDDRKNTWKILDAFAALPQPVRESHQLVFTFHLNQWGRNAIVHHIMKLGLDDQVVITGEVSDETLRLLYQRCNAFAFPSLYEGFGLPILEAMHCGAAVVAGNNSSQIEVVGDAGLLADASDSHDISAKILAILDNPALRADLGRRALAQSACFSWDATGSKALDAIQSTNAPACRSPRLRFDRGHVQKPRVAFFSPLPPRKSGISDYAALLLDELRKTYRIDLFHDSGYIPEPSLHAEGLANIDFRLFDRIAAVKDYHAVVYQMGNSHYHNFLYPTMLRHPGVVTLHDFCLAGFHTNYGRFRGHGLDFIRDELLHWYPRQHLAILDMLDECGPDNEAIARRCAKNGWYLNERTLESSVVTVVHSPWCASQVEKQSPQFADRMTYIPFGIRPLTVSAEQKARTREQFQVPANALVLSSFGFVHPDKMCPQALDAFAVVAERDPSAVFLFIGEEADGGAVRRHAESLGLTHRVRFLGRQPADAFDALMAITDVGINLRLPPTNGETSAALLNLLAFGVATVVTDVATFSDYSDAIVRKFRWETDGQAGLLRCILELTSSREARESLGRAAWTYVNEYHDWPRVTSLYADAIERCHDELARERPSTSRTAYAPARLA